MDTRSPADYSIGNRTYAQFECVRHATREEECVVIVTNSKGERRFLTQTEWHALAQKVQETEPPQVVTSNSQNGNTSCHVVQDSPSQTGIVTSQSSTKDKVELFKSLFKGRTDCYAHAYPKKGGGVSYTPACAHDATQLCPRYTGRDRGIKCASCDNRSLLPLTDEVLIKHFLGKDSKFRDIVGLYLLSEGNKTQVLVADFDEGNWQHEVALFVSSCKRHGLNPAIERSRSGSGAHVWFFFAEPIDASLAREFGSVLITQAMNMASGMGFRAYDRLYPSQDYIEKGGFGSLIALPLQGQAQRLSNSVFVDEKYQPFTDQWRYLSAVEKLTELQVRLVVESAETGPLGQLSSFRHEKSRSSGTNNSQRKKKNSNSLLTSKPGTPKSPNSKNSNLSQEDFPELLTIVQSNMLYVNKDGVSPRAQNALKRLAAFSNPEYYRARNAGRSLYGKRRIIWCGEEDENHILLPRGCQERLTELLTTANVAWSLKDERVKHESLRVRFTGELRVEQQEAVDTLLESEWGILSAPPGFGKTVMAAAAIARLGMPALILVPETVLLTQWLERLGQFLEVEDNRSPELTKSGRPSKRMRPLIGRIGAGKYARSGFIDVATYQALVTKDELGIPCAKPVLNDYDLIICDECHHCAARGPQLILQSTQARRVYGLSATPKRGDGLTGLIYLSIGPIRYAVNPKKQARQLNYSRILRPRFTRIRLKGLEIGTSFNQVVDKICTHHERNALIATDAMDELRKKKSPMVVTRRVDHARLLAKLIEDSGATVHLLTGKGSAREKREKLEKAHERTPDSVIVATGSYVGEGFDLPWLNVLLLASPYSFEGLITQYSGRLHREFEDKDEVIIYDYVDTSVPMLERMYKKRMKTYTKLGYVVEAGDDEKELGTRASIEDEFSWQSVFKADLARSEKSVYVSVPYMSMQQINELKESIEAATRRGVDIRVVVKTALSDDVAERQKQVCDVLEETGCRVTVSDEVNYGIAVFDEAVAWFGTLPLLAYARQDDCSLRVASCEVAADLLEQFTCG